MEDNFRDNTHHQSTVEGDNNHATQAHTKPPYSTELKWIRDRVTQQLAIVGKTSGTAIMRAFFDASRYDKPPRASLDISHTLKAPKIPAIDTQAISHEQADEGIKVHIPGSPRMQFGDHLVFYWGMNRSSTPIFHEITDCKTLRILCISYKFLACPQFGPVDTYFEVHRNNRLVGTSPTLRVNVDRKLPEPREGATVQP